MEGQMMKKEIKNTILIVDDEVIVKKSLEEVKMMS